MAAAARVAAGQTPTVGARLRRVPGWLRDRPWTVLATLLAGYLVARVTILARSTVHISYDTSSYATRPGAEGGTVSTLSFAGHAPRPWGVPALYAVLASDQLRAVAQWTIGTLAWATLAYAIWLQLRSMTARVVATILIVVLALTPTVYVWDHALLSESLSISLGVLALALLAIWARTGSRVALVALVATGFWWTFTRQDVLPFVGLLAATLVLYAWRRRVRRWPAGVAAGVLLIGIGWHAATLSATDVAFGSWGEGFTLSEGTFLYRLRFQVLPDRQMTSFYHERLGMPDCPEAERVARGRAWAMAAFTDAYLGCPDLSAWARRHGEGSGYRYALAQPGHYARTTLQTMPKTLNGRVTVPVKRVDLVPGPARRVLFPPAGQVLPTTLVVLVLAVAGWALTGGRSGERWLVAAGLAVVGASMVNTVITLMYAAGDYSRFGIQEAILVRIGVIMVVVAAIDAALAWRARAVAARSVAQGRSSR